MARPDGAPGAGKALVLLALSAIPMTALIMWIGLSGGGRNAEAELYWLGPLPEAPVGAPAPFDVLRPGMPLADAQSKLPALLGVDLAEDKSREVIAFEGRSLTRTYERDGGAISIRIESGAQNVTVRAEGDPPRVTRVRGGSLRPFSVPEGWGEPEVLAAGTTSELRHWAKDGLHFTLAEGGLQQFSLSAEPPAVAAMPAESAPDAPEWLGAWPDEPGLPSALAGVRLGASRRVVLAATATLADSPEVEHETKQGGPVTIDEWTRAGAGLVDVSADPVLGVVGVSIKRPGHPLADRLLARWRPADEVEPGAYVWLDRERSRQVRVYKNPKGTIVRLEAAWTLEDLFGDDPQRLPLETPALLGRTLDELKARFPTVDRTPILPPRPVLSLKDGEPPTLHVPSVRGMLEPRVLLDMKGGRVRRLMVDLPYFPDPEPILAELRRLWPALRPVLATDDGHLRLFAVEGPRTVAVVIKANTTGRIVAPAEDWRPYQLLRAGKAVDDLFETR